MTRNRLYATAAAAFALALAAPAVAQQTHIDVSAGATNSSGDLYLNNYLPTAGSTVAIGGIDFLLSGTSGQNFVYPVATGTMSSFTYAVSIPNVTTIYTLANSFYGEAPNTIGTITFTDAANDTFTYFYTEGVNIRDYLFNTYNNVAPGVYGTAIYGPGGFRNQDNLDAQQIVLPSSFATSTLTSITFAGTAAAGNPNGEPALFAITAVSGSAVPEPAAWAMMIVGLGAVGVALRYRRRGTAVRLA